MLVSFLYTILYTTKQTYSYGNSHSLVEIITSTSMVDAINKFRLHSSQIVLCSNFFFFLVSFLQPPSFQNLHNMGPAQKYCLAKLPFVKRIAKNQFTKQFLQLPFYVIKIKALTFHFQCICVHLTMIPSTNNIQEDPKKNILRLKSPVLHFCLIHAACCSFVSSRLSCLT